MEPFTVPVLLLAVAALWSATQLVTRDTITARPRRALRIALRGRRHRGADYDWDDKRCTCGWRASLTPMADPDANGTQLWRFAATGSADLLIDTLAPESSPHPWDRVDPERGVELGRLIVEERDLHLELAYAGDAGYLFTLATCPHCVAFWLAIPVVASALAWGNGWGWQLVAGALGLRAPAGAAVAALGPSDDDDPTDDRP